MSALPLERWLAIPGYEGSYEVSSLGRVKSVARKVERRGRWGQELRTISERFLALTPDKGRYAYGRLTAKLSLAGKAKTRLVHQLVAEAFLGPCPEGMQVAHNDGDPANNCLSNLRYATPAENTRDKFRHGTMLRGEMVGNSKLTADRVRLIRESGLSVTRAAQEFGVSIAHISRIRSGSRWGHVR